MRLWKVCAALAGALCIAAAPAYAQLTSQVLVSGLSSPVGFVQDPTQANVQFVVEQGGRIRVIRDGVLLSQSFLDLSGQITSGGEQGLLGLAFPPDAVTTRRLFVNFTNTSGHTVIARFQRMASDPLRVDASTRFDLGWPGCTRYIAQPFSNHNGGNLAFGDDGYLYIALGDGGSGGDPFNNAQRGDTLLGKVLRLDVSVADSNPRGYDAPADNPRPFGASVGTGVLCNTAVPYQQTGYSELIWDVGLRNPWRYTFDLRSHGGSGALIIGDVGQGAWEEINFEPYGTGNRNYGWRRREGAHDYDPSMPPATLPLIEPIHDYSHSTGQAVMGGEVYRGTSLQYPYFGRYFFADYSSNRVWSFRLTLSPSSGEATASDLYEHTTELGGASAYGYVSAFGLDANCEIYMVSHTLGRILRITGSTGSSGGSGCATADPFLSLGGGLFMNPGWLPPNHPAGAGLTMVLNSSSSNNSGDAGNSGDSGNSGNSGNNGGSAPCAGSDPFVGIPGMQGVCVNGGWVPSTHPLAQSTNSNSGNSGSSGDSGTSGSTSCVGVDPFASIPGMHGVCINGGWVPSGHPLAGGL